MDSAIFAVREKTREEFFHSPHNGGVIEEHWDDTDIFHIESYPYGCEGDGHFLSTELEPGTYKVVRVETS